MKTAAVFFNQAPQKPYRLSPSMVNGIIEDAVENAGYRIDERQYSDVYHIHEHRMPFLHIRQAIPARRRIDAASPVDLSVYCDTGLSICPPDRRASNKNIVVFHGLGSNHGLWLGNDSIDVFCANSRYLRDVLVSFLASPIWETQSVLDRRAFSCVDILSLAVPCTEEASGFIESLGESLPHEVAAILDGQDIVGHALQGSAKIDRKATVATMIYANRVALERGLARRVRLLVRADELGALSEQLEHVEMLRGAFADLRLSVDDVFVPVPLLRQRDLYDVFARCQFGLAYNVYPEPFGFYVLESVFSGCPVYTNGAGAMRSTLPPGHGIHVYETEGMALGDLSEYAAVAETIVGDVAACARLTAQCQLGREYITTHYGRRNTYSDMNRCLARAESVPREPVWEFQDLVLALSPLVRIWNAATGALVSDYTAMRLAANERDILIGALGRTVADVKRLFPGEEFGTIRRWFEQGVLAFEVPESERPSTSPD